jgi:mono/diheme cytochrome c family protein
MTGGATNSIKVTPNGAVPYPYQDNDADRTRAANELLQNPFPITASGLVRGQVLYTTYCGICHGEKGDGAGYLVREADPAKGIVAGVYPAAPANFLKENFLDTTNGFFYHAIMYGKNMMGPYADRLSYEERWQVIHYIRSLQAKQLKLVYNENENTYTSDVPGGPMLAKLHMPASHPVLGPEAMPGDTAHVAPVDTTHTGSHGVGDKEQGEH